VSVERARLFALKQYPDAKTFRFRVLRNTWFNFHCGRRGVVVLVEVGTSCSKHLDTKMHLTICACSTCETEPDWREAPSYDYGI